MTNRQESHGSFYATAIRSKTQMRDAIDFSTQFFGFHKMESQYVDFLKLSHESPDWLTQNNFARIRAVSSLSGMLFWTTFLDNMSYPQEELVRQNLIPESFEDYVGAGHEMQWRSDGFNNTPLMFAIAAAAGKHARRFFRIGIDYKDEPTIAAPSMPAAKAGDNFGHAAYHPIEYYQRLTDLFPSSGIDSGKTAWRYLWEGNSFEESGTRCPGSGLTRAILAEFGKVVATDEFRQRILTGK